MKPMTDTEFDGLADVILGQSTETLRKIIDMLREKLGAELVDEEIRNTLVAEDGDHDLHSIYSSTIIGLLVDRVPFA